MISFKSFLTEEQNTHMQHIQNLVLYRGVKGTRQAIEALRDLRDTISGHTDKAIDLTMKWDGAPAIFFGQVPSGEPDAGKFFVAKKGLFAKTPKFYMTPADVDADISSPDLNAKMKLALKYLKDLKPSGIFQGDMMYSHDDIKAQSIDGEDYVTFHPNTILYAVPLKSPLAKTILKSKIGIVLHTEYTGNTWESLSANYSVSRDVFSKTKNVWFDDATVHDVSGTVTLTKKETTNLNNLLSFAGKNFHKISSSTLKELEKNQLLARTIETYNNTFVRTGATTLDPRKHVDGLIKYISDKYQKAIDKLKTEKGKSRKEKERDEFLVFFSNKNRKELIFLFELQNALVEAKLIIINKLNQINSMSTFLRTKNGFQVTGHEGFVAIDHIKGNAFKLVDQLNFSYANFSDEVLKGWDSPTR